MSFVCFHIVGAFALVGEVSGHYRRRQRGARRSNKSRGKRAYRRPDSLEVVADEEDQVAALDRAEPGKLDPDALGHCAPNPCCSMSPRLIHHPLRTESHACPESAALKAA
jgi:hypothetical protein